MGLNNIGCDEFVEVLASKAPVPGGGGASALVGAVGTALGNMVGNALEVKEAMEILNGGGNKDLRDLCIVLATYMVSMAKNMDYMQAQGEVLRAIRTKEAYNKFLELVKYQGGDIKSLKGKFFLNFIKQFQVMDKIIMAQKNFLKKWIIDLKIQ